MVAVVAAVVTFATNAPAAVSDEAFVARANAVCETAAGQRPTPAPADATMTQRADAVEASVNVLEAMVADLERMEVAAQDQAAVRAWLADWREMIAAGRRFAEAIRAEGPDAAEVGNAADAPGMRVEEFARRNGLDACVF